MYPFSYTSLKIIHDQQIEEALERQRLDADQKKPASGLLPMFYRFLDRFHKEPIEMQQQPCKKLVDTCQ